MTSVYLVMHLIPDISYWFHLLNSPLLHCCCRLFNNSSVKSVLLVSSCSQFAPCGCFSGFYCKRIKLRMSTEKAERTNPIYAIAWNYWHVQSVCCGRFVRFLRFVVVVVVILFFCFGPDRSSGFVPITTGSINTKQRRLAWWKSIWSNWPVSWGAPQSIRW